MYTITTFYHFEITTSERVINVFGTVMFHTDVSVLVDLWCPEEPYFTQRAEFSSQETQHAIEALIQKKMVKSCFSEGKFVIRLLSY
jgi:hypothetical protein